MYFHFLQFISFMDCIQIAWDNLKKKVIEDKLEELGVERGSGSNVPHIYAPHARSASVRQLMFYTCPFSTINRIS